MKKKKTKTEKYAVMAKEIFGNGDYENADPVVQAWWDNATKQFLNMVKKRRRELKFA